MSGNLFSTTGNSAGEWVTAHCDGGSRGNPGPSGYGAVLEDDKGCVLAELSEFVGIQTNNFAEYSGLLGVLKWAVHNNVRRLRVISDSELMVKQMQGKYKVASPILRPLWEEARRLSHRMESFEIRHTLRGGNKDADRLANKAMDRGMGRAPALTPEKTVKSRQISSAVARFGEKTARPTSESPEPPVAKPASQPDRKLSGRQVFNSREEAFGPAVPSGRASTSAKRAPAPTAPVPALAKHSPKPAPQAPAHPPSAHAVESAPVHSSPFLLSAIPAPPPTTPKKRVAAPEQAPVPAPARATIAPPPHAVATAPVSRPAAPAPKPVAKPARTVLEGYVKGGVVHLVEGELPDGVFVKIIFE